MGLFTKLKDILFEEEVEETTEITKLEKEKKKTNITKSRDIRDLTMPKKQRKEEAKVEDIIDEKIKHREVYKNDPTFPFPLAFEEDVKEVKSRSLKNTNIMEIEPRRKKERSFPSKNILEVAVKTEKAKPFCPSPIISPVYGILDKNYKKEDVVNKVRNDLHDTIPDFDAIRKKAYGTLEDDIENVLDNPIEPVIEKKTSNKTIDELLLDTLNVEMTSEVNLPKTIGEAEELLEDEPVLDEKDDNLENDLFDLIDSMYERRKDGEQ